MSDDYPPRVSDVLEEQFLGRVRNVESMEQAIWLTALYESLSDWDFDDARWQAHVIDQKYDDGDLLWAVDEHFGEWLNESASRTETEGSDE